MSFTIRNAQKIDMPQVLSLIKELAVFEKEPDAVEVTISDLEIDGFSKNPSFHCFVAEVNGKIEGLALVYNRYSTWKGKALHLEDLGCATVMPLGSPIGSGQGLNNLSNIKIIIENSSIPVIVDAGIGTPSEAAMAMELGADGVLMNTAVAQSRDPEKMAYAMNLAVKSGRLAYSAGRMDKKLYASPSSPINQISKL